MDRETLTADAWGDAALPANSWVSPNILNYMPGKNLEGAKKILKKAGYTLVDGKLHYPAGMMEMAAAYQ